MGVIRDVRNRFRLMLNPSLKYYTKDGKPKTVISSGKAGGFSGGGGGRSDALLKAYWNNYKTDGTVFASIQTTAWNAVMTGYHLISEDEKKKEEVKKFLSSIDFDGIMLDNVVYALVFGDAFIEKVRSGKEIVALKTVDPITVQINTDEFGRVESYQQKIQGQLGPEIKKEDIIHLKFFNSPSSPYGISLIEPSRIVLNRKLVVDDSIANAIIRHGTGKYVVTVGTPDEIPDDDVFTAIRSKLEDITANNEFIVPGSITIEEIDQKGIQGVEQYYNYFQTQLVIGLLCPEEALGLGRGSTEATSKVKEIMYERMIKSLQHKMSELMVRELVNDYLGVTDTDKEGVVRFRYNSVTDSDEAVKSKWMGNLFRGFPEGRKPFSINEVRAKFDFDPVEDGDTLDWSSKYEEGPGKGEQEGGSTKEEKPKEEKPSDQEKENARLKKDIKDLYALVDALSEELNELRDSNYE